VCDVIVRSACSEQGWCDVKRIYDADVFETVVGGEICMGMFVRCKIWNCCFEIIFHVNMQKASENQVNHVDTKVELWL
jgi:hypothetical protein